MKFDSIAVFGDSWVWGDELVDPVLASQGVDVWSRENDSYRLANCFTGRLSSHFGIPAENFGYPGASLTSMVWSYLWWLEHKGTPSNALVLVALTDPWRTSFYNPGHIIYENDPPWHRFVHTSWAASQCDIYHHDWHHMIKLHSVLTNSPESSRLNLWEKMLFWQGQHAMWNSVFQFHVLHDNGVPSVDLTGHLMPGQCLADYVDAPHFKCAQGHPNELGHQVIANVLINRLKPVII